MSSSNANREKLFAKTVPVSITDGSFTNLRSLFLSIEWQQTATMKKELFITLTDNSDPFFLYDLQLSDDDFQRLKSSQNLLMDFSAFPQTVIHFLELCLNEAKESQPNYLLHLIKGERVGNIPPSAQLDIEQSSVFRQVSLLSLKFFAATDSTITQHVTIGFRNLKEENQRLQNQLCHLENNFRAKVSDLESALEKKSQELENVKRELNAEIDKRESWHSQMLREEREKLLNKQREGENRLESERIDRETKLKRDIEHLEARVSCLERLNKELENKKTELERQLSALRSHNLSVETDLRLKSEALTNAERKNSELIADFKESSGRINHLMGNIKDLNETLKRKEKQIDGLQRDLDNSKKEKKKIASGLSAAEEQLDKEKKARKEVEHEHLKAIQIIAKYQDTVCEETDKNKALIKKTTKLEGTSNKQEQEIQYLENELKRESNTNQRLAIEIEQIRVYQETIGKLEGENRKLNLYNSEITKLLHENNLILEYRPPPCFAENFPICEAINGKASGDDLHEKENSPLPFSAAQSKSIPRLQPETRQNGTNLPGYSTNLPVYNCNSLQSETRQMNMGVSRNLADSTPQALNAKVSTIIASDNNANQSNLEINSNGLSSEFQDLNISKHSTARKQTKSVKSRLPRKN